MSETWGRAALSVSSWSPTLTQVRTLLLLIHGGITICLRMEQALPIGLPA